jgi:hypothetical protein
LKLVHLAQKSIRLIEEAGPQGVRSDVIAQMLDSPKRRVYDIVAILKALGLVTTKRKSDGTTLMWIDRSADYVGRSDYEEAKARLTEATAMKNDLQVQVAELKEEVRLARLKLRREVQTVETAQKTEFDTTQLRVRALSRMGFKKVTDSGMEVVIETHNPGMMVDPSEKAADKIEALIRNLDRT